ncbi:NAD(P)H-dependent oxidoreductase [Fictibacillus phosphorivorans]|uniref:NAD(P)H-dependent oxidoreductase n=1 Tax=Fictibacillus phosphorivorans TaxID=1221500 RepID=A0A160IS92_9BACL|nr:flavodoxin family protein [Fictibacillus phosphorivorans]ANC79433.1 NAD(P)H-dependent oxidoreductase [Fictibacillus phosphorivorans]
MAVINGSSRENGNTDALTQKALDGIRYTSFYLKNYKINPIDDQRHVAGGFDKVEDDYDELISQVLQHDVLIFATPVYWYGMSGVMKNFVDRFSQSLRDEALNFKKSMSDKKAYVITVGGDHPRIKALPLIQQFQYIFDFLGTEFAGYLIGEANAPTEIFSDALSLENALTFNKALLKHTEK